jgi:hypothetical protein
LFNIFNTQVNQRWAPERSGQLQQCVRQPEETDSARVAKKDAVVSSHQRGATAIDEYRLFR